MAGVVTALSIVAVLPQCLQAAKDIYDLRARFKDASVLITAIYSESLVIAASLSQIQDLLQHDALQTRPDLAHTFDAALTGCRVVYGCLAEEVQALADKAQSDELKRRDKLKYLWKEDTFKELLQQIRGQQSALSLLLQGLQMQNIAEIKKLVQDNTATLDKVVTRSNTLRRSHPTVRVPQSVFDKDPANPDNMDDASTLIGGRGEFAFDDEIVNSRAYRKALAVAAAKADGKLASADDIERELLDEDHTLVQPEDHTLIQPQDHGDEQDFAPMPEIEPLRIGSKSPSKVQDDDNVQDDSKVQNGGKVQNDGKVQDENKVQDSGEVQDGKNMTESEPKAKYEAEDIKEEHTDLFDSLEGGMLPFMPPMFSSKASLNPTGYGDPDEPAPPPYQESTPVSNAAQVAQDTAAPANSVDAEDEAPPPLPPRRVSQPLSSSADMEDLTKSLTSSISGISMLSTATSASAASSASSRTVSSPLAADAPAPLKISRKPLLSQSCSGTSATESGDVSASVSSPGSQEAREVWNSLVAEEQNFVDRMTKFRTIFYDRVVEKQPQLQKHLEVVTLGQDIVETHVRFLLGPLQSQLEQSSSTTGNAGLFKTWAERAHKLYQEYSQRVPHAEGSVNLTMRMNPAFKNFVDNLGLSLVWFGKTWGDYLRLPITQLDVYIQKLGQLITLTQDSRMSAAGTDASGLEAAVAILHRLRTSCQKQLTENGRREENQSLSRRIHTLDSSFLSRLNLHNFERRIVFQGKLAIKVNGTGAWQRVHAALLDNYLVWGKEKAPKSSSWKVTGSKNPYSSTGQDMWVLEAPIPIGNLDLQLPHKDSTFQRAGILDDMPRGTLLYHMFVRDRTTSAQPHAFGAFGPIERNQWMDHINSVTLANAATTAV